MGDVEKTFLKLNFDPKVRLEFRGATITSDAPMCRFYRASSTKPGHRGRAESLMKH